MPWITRPPVPQAIFLDGTQSRYQWPSHLVEHTWDDLYGCLHDRFNTVPFYIQDPFAFHRDATELAYKSDNQEHFYKLMEERKHQRLEELREAFDKITSSLSEGYSAFTLDQTNAIDSAICYGSFDRLVEFFASFLGPNKRGKEPFPDKSLQRGGRGLKKDTVREEPTVPDDLPPTQSILSPSRPPTASSPGLRSAKRKRHQAADDESPDSEPPLAPTPEVKETGYERERELDMPSQRLPSTQRQKRGSTDTHDNGSRTKRMRTGSRHSQPHTEDSSTTWRQDQISAAIKTTSEAASAQVAGQHITRLEGQDKSEQPAARVRKGNQGPVRRGARRARAAGVTGDVAPVRRSARLARAAGTK
ncbi:hypothetical protein F4778DRAFT_739979 [Xylariomycetidae sp. FL2044]|nr:hypothetical protein F4778DRAFT_739979 [Xylariomycetidae sp. FL2044]